MLNSYDCCGEWKSWFLRMNGRRMLYRAEKEKQQLKIEVEQAKEQVENVGKAKVRSNMSGSDE